jgi:predicted nucleotidyltransferase
MLPLQWNWKIIVNDIRSETLRELKESLETFLGDRLLRMILFGSIARGDYTDESDIDVAIIIRGLTRELKHQILDRVAEVELNHLMPVSALLLSEEEFNRLKKRERRIALDIEGEGIPL